MPNTFSINKFLPVAFLYFFVNGLFLPVGVFYTSLLAPFFILWIIKNKKTSLLFWFVTLMLPFTVIHLVNGVILSVYIKSYALIFTVFVFCICFYIFLTTTNSIGEIFKQIVIWNFLLTIVAVVLLFAGGGKELWYEGNLTPGSETVLRLKMFTTEASVYSSMLVPIVLFYYLKLLLYKLKSPWLLFIMVTVPLVLSLSFGVLLGLFLTILFVLFSDVKLFFVKPHFAKRLVGVLILAFTAIIVLIFVYPDNVVFLRLVNVFEGNDSSFRGRTTDAFYLGYLIADMKSVLFGAGPGQIKELGMDLFTKFYVHTFTKDTITIPNATAETLAIFGLIGLLLRFAVTIWLFFKTKVYTNYYRLALFIFIFIYQFTGSYITNIPEYLIWIIAFTPGFKEFDKSVVHNKPQHQLSVQ
ncbi:MAG: hypothetical protein ACK5DG_01265 [Chitinophagaceae bacterium]|jgi:hypothetical protein